MKAATPALGGLFEQFPSLRSRVEELARRLEKRAPMLAARVMADLTADSGEEPAPGDSAEQPLMIRSIIDLVEGRSLLIEKTLGAVLGMSEQELMQSSFLERVHPDDRRRTLRIMGRLAGGRMLESFQIRHRHADGSFVVFEWSAVADDAGETCYAVAVISPGEAAALS